MCPFKSLIFAYEILICNPKFAVIAKLMIKLLQPFRRPLFRSIAYSAVSFSVLTRMNILTPWSFPFPLSPRVLEAEKTMPVNLDSLLNRVCMAFDDTSAVRSAETPNTGAAAEKKVLIHFEKFIFPKVFLSVC